MTDDANRTTSEKPNPLDMPMLRAEFEMPDGTMLTRDWSMTEAHDPSAEKLRETPPSWLENPRRAWDHPQDPITYKGKVKAGHEADAREFLCLDT